MSIIVNFLATVMSGRGIFCLAVAVVAALFYGAGLRDVYRKAKDTGEIARISSARRWMLTLLVLAVLGLLACVTASPALRRNFVGMLIVGLACLVLFAAVTAFSRHQKSESHHAALFWPVVALGILFGTNLMGMITAVSGRNLSLLAAILIWACLSLVACALFAAFGRPRDPIPEQTPRQEAVSYDTVGEEAPFSFVYIPDYVLEGDDWGKKNQDGSPKLNKLGESLRGSILGAVLAASSRERAVARYERYKQRATSGEKGQKEWKDLQLQLFSILLELYPTISLDGWNAGVGNLEETSGFTTGRQYRTYIQGILEKVDSLPSIGDYYDYIREPDPDESGEASDADPDAGLFDDEEG